MNDPGAIAIVAEHLNGAYGFTMKTEANDFLHRVLPLRDPDQHRFWCVVVVRCTAGGLPDHSQSPWIGLRGLRREELSETMAAIRDDLSAWLKQPEQTELRELVFEPSEAAASLGSVQGLPSPAHATLPGAPTDGGPILDDAAPSFGQQQAFP